LVHAASLNRVATAWQILLPEPQNPSPCRPLPYHCRHVLTTQGDPGPPREPGVAVRATALVVTTTMTEPTPIFDELISQSPDLDAGRFSDPDAQASGDLAAGDGERRDTRGRTG
jgi:hypothetical protein